MPSYKLSYFNIEGAAEPVRLAFTYYGIPFEDDRVKFEDWPELKKKAKFGQMPLLSIDGAEPMAQSGAMLRMVGRLGDGSLYPQSPAEFAKIEETIGLIDDLAKAFSPCLYIAMRPEIYGYASDLAKTDEGQSKIKELRAGFHSTTLPQFLKYFEEMITKSGGFICSADKPTIADCLLLPGLRRFQKGFIDHIPTTVLDNHPIILDYIKRMMSIPAIQKWYEAHP